MDIHQLTLTITEQKALEKFAKVIAKNAMKLKRPDLAVINYEATGRIALSDTHRMVIIENGYKGDTSYSELLDTKKLQNEIPFETAPILEKASTSVLQIELTNIEDLAIATKHLAAVENKANAKHLKKGIPATFKLTRLVNDVHLTSSYQDPLVEYRLVFSEEVTGSSEMTVYVNATYLSELLGFLLDFGKSTATLYYLSPVSPLLIKSGDMTILLNPIIRTTHSRNE